MQPSIPIYLQRLCIQEEKERREDVPPSRPGWETNMGPTEWQPIATSMPACLFGGGYTNK
jgi:hypothetical protein